MSLKNELVKCEVCKCLGYRKDFHEVTRTNDWWNPTKEYFCLTHKPNYDKVHTSRGNEVYSRIIREHTEVVKNP